MPLEFTGSDIEFAAATGNNIDAGNGSSTFDDPPSSFTDLIVTANEGDGDPRVFEIGDSYDLSWNEPSGSHTMEDAVVVRSDAAPGNGGVIVLEGTNELGETVHIIWTPGFDLENWYNNNSGENMTTGFYTSDTQPGYDHKYVCFSADTLIDTATGLRSAGSLRQGDLVTTHDAGNVPIEWTAQWNGSGLGDAAPVCFAPGTIGNSRPLRLSQQHRVLVRSSQLQTLFGFDEALAPAKAFVNGQDITLQACPRICYVHILLPEHHLITAEGALCESLYLGDEASRRILSAARYDPNAHKANNSSRRMKAARPLLRFKEAQLLSAQEKRISKLLVA
jgi:hypothetical protein